MNKNFFCAFFAFGLSLDLITQRAVEIIEKAGIITSEFFLRFKDGVEIWSGRRDSNPRLQPWQGCALPLSYARIIYTITTLNL